MPRGLWVLDLHPFYVGSVIPTATVILDSSRRGTDGLKGSVIPL